MKKQILSIATLLISSLSAKAQYYDWAVHSGAPLSGSGMAQAYAVAVDAAGSVYSAGYFSGTVDFDPGAGIFNITSPGQNIFIQKVDKWGNFVWAKDMKGGQGGARGIAIDNNGYVYVTGQFQGTIDADPGAGTANLVSGGSYDIFIEKLDTAGNYVWGKRIGGSTSDAGEAVVLDASGNVYLTGNFSGTTDMDPGAGVYNLSGGLGSVILEKLDASGNFAWAKNIGDAKSGTGVGLGTSLTFDNAGNIFVTGRFKNTLDFDPGTGTSNLTVFVTGNFNGFVSKLDGSGNLLWATQIGGNSNCYSNSIVADGKGNVYVGGFFDYTIDLDPGTATVNVTDMSVTGGFNSFIVKLDASGNYTWGRHMESAASVQLIAMQADEGGNIYSTGQFQGTADFDPGTGVFNMSTPGMSVGHGYLLKLNDNGNFVWAKEDDCTNSAQPDAIAMDAQNNIYLVGAFSGTCDFDPGAGVASLSVLSGSSDMFVQKLYQFKYGSDAQTACGSYTFGSATYTASGTYTDTMTAVLGMDSVITLTLTVNPMPDAGTITGTNTVCSGASITLTDVVGGGTWRVAGTRASVAAGVVTGVTPGTDKVLYIVNNTCGADTATFDITVTNCNADAYTANTLQNQTGMAVWPNPNNGDFTISFSKDHAADVQVTITDMLGKKIKEVSIRTATNVPVQLDVSAGIYFVTAVCEQESITKKIVVAK
ncbi:MAG: hypothetical protein JWQ38_2127 [Flavipsychrobacter sp.]|nr:hypothetical protein [Flavipsychrobacter sp.]